ncbi:MAG: hypothetical protein IKN57_12055, partial [Parasporobacterium sp.]|nr:hypothetical protein [Parasporobacterium sp.]
REGNLDIRLFNFMSPGETDKTAGFSFSFETNFALLDLFYESGKQEEVRIAINGSRFTNLMGDDAEVTRLLLCDGAWTKDDEFTVNARWVETCFVKKLIFEFREDTCTIREAGTSSPFGPKPVPAVYRADQ